MVLSTFQVVSDRVLALRLSGWGQEILTTTVHPFWSESRQAWVAAGRLQLGETVRSRDGHGCRLESATPVAGQHTVYNLEVEGDHVYRVGAGGVLVHNTCPPDTKKLADEAHALLDPETAKRTTTAIGVREDGSLSIASSEKNVPDVQREWAKKNGISSVDAVGHAETTLASDHDMFSGKVVHIDASRPICPNCADDLKRKNITTKTPLKKKK